MIQKRKNIFIAGIVAAISGLILLLMKGRMFAIVENAPISISNYQKTFSSTNVWNQFINAPAADSGIFNFRTYLIYMAKLTHLELGQIIALFKVSLVTLSVYGFYKLINFLNARYFENYLDSKLMMLSALVFALNPSYLIGDNFWMGIQVEFYTLPLILFCSLKVLSGRHKYLAYLMVLFSFNNAIHFIFGGWQIMIALISIGFYFLERHRTNVRVVKVAIRFALIMLVFVIASASMLLGTLHTATPGASVLTKQSIDTPWSSALLTNLGKGMSYTNITNDFYHFPNIISFFVQASFWLILLIPFLLCFLLLKSKRDVPRRLLLTTLSLVLLFLVIELVFATNSPFSASRDWLVQNAPIGRAFRTWRVPEAIVALLNASEAAILLSFLGKNFKHKLTKKLLIALPIVIIALYVLPVFLGRINGAIIKTPTDYKNIGRVIKPNSNEITSMVYTPEFTNSFGVSSGLKPQWSQYDGMMTEFLGYSAPVRSIIPIGQDKTFYKYSSSEFYKNSNLIMNDDSYALSKFYALLNINYLAIHKDLPTEYSKINTDKIMDNSSWKSLGSVGAVKAYKNTVSGSDVTVTPQNNVVKVQGGYRAVKNNFDQVEHSNENNDTYIFEDQDSNVSAVDYAGKVLTDKSTDQSNLDELYENLVQTHYKYINFPAETTSTYNPLQAWSVGSYSSDQDEWQPYINNVPNYEWDFDYGKGYLFTSKPTVYHKFAINTGKIINGKLMVRYLANSRGGAVKISANGYTFDINTKSDYNGMQWKVIDYKGTLNKLSVTNVSGFNAISSIAALTTSDYRNETAIAKKELEGKPVINSDVNQLQNLVQDGQMKGDSSWIFTQGTQNVNLAYESPQQGDNSGVMSVKNDTTNKWSWVGSPWVKISTGERYQYSTQMKVTGATNSHTVLLIRNSVTGKESQLSQLPSATSGNTGWLNNTVTVRIPSGYDQARVLLNAGWKKSVESPTAVTEFRDIKFVKLDNIKSNDSSVAKNLLISTYSVNPSFRLISLRTSIKPVLVSTQDTFYSGWKAYILPSSFKVTRLNENSLQSIGPPLSDNRHVEVNSLTNGWWVSPSDIRQFSNGEYKIAIVYTPQKFYSLGLIVQFSGLITAAAALLIIRIKGTKE